MLKCKRCGKVHEDDLDIYHNDEQIGNTCWCGGKLIKVKEAAQNQKPVSK